MMMRQQAGRSSLLAFLVWATTALVASGKLESTDTNCALGQSFLAAPSPVNVATLNGRNGFAVLGQAATDNVGFSVGSSADVNGDGVQDLVIGAQGVDVNNADSAGAAYVVYGKPPDHNFPPGISTFFLDGKDGFSVQGVKTNDALGRSVSMAGDLNSDGVPDLVVGAYRGDSQDGLATAVGNVHVMFGGSFGMSQSVSSLNGSNGFTIFGVGAGDNAGAALASGHDLNGDGIADLAIGAPAADNSKGEVYVIFGKPQGESFNATIKASDLDGTHGFRISGATGGDKFGTSVDISSDLNSDGVNDLVVGAHEADAGAVPGAGEVYVLFGRSQGQSFEGSMIASLIIDGTTGFKLQGAEALEAVGWAVSGGGDVNGDGAQDLVVGAYMKDWNGMTDAGAVYVLYGKAQGQSFASTLLVTALDGSNGFSITGIDASDLMGVAVSSGGDVNGDGYDDVAIGASEADPQGVAGAGEVYVVFGRPHFNATMSAADVLGGVHGFVLEGSSVEGSLGFAVSARSDLNGDGLHDVVTGAYQVDVKGEPDAGAAYVYFGVRSGCFACVNGTYKNYTGPGACYQCPATTSSQAGSTSKAHCICAQGYVMGSSAQNCSACPAGTFKASLGNGNCSRCANAKPVDSVYSDRAVITAQCPFACRPGYYWAVNGCGACKVGTYKATTGNEDCSACVNIKPVHTEYLGEAGSSSQCAHACAPGHRWDVLAGSCLPCRVGEYKAETSDSDTCQKCSNKPEGMLYSHLVGLTSPDCPWVCDGGGTSECPVEPGDLAVVSVSILTPMGEQEFTPEKQQRFRTAVASTAAVGVKHVALAAFTNIGTRRVGASRHLLTGTLKVDTEINSDGFSTNELITRITEAALNVDMNREGLPAVTILEGPELKRGPLVVPTAKPDNSLPWFEIAVFGGGGAGLGLIMALIYFFYCRAKVFPPKEEKPAPRESEDELDVDVKRTKGWAYKTDVIPAKKVEDLEVETIGRATSAPSHDNATATQIANKFSDAVNKNSTRRASVAPAPLKKGSKWANVQRQLDIIKKDFGEGSGSGRSGSPLSSQPNSAEGSFTSSPLNSNGPSYNAGRARNSIASPQTVKRGSIALSDSPPLRRSATTKLNAPSGASADSVSVQSNSLKRAGTRGNISLLNKSPNESPGHSPRRTVSRRNSGEGTPGKKIQLI